VKREPKVAVLYHVSDDGNGIGELV